MPRTPAERFGTCGRAGAADEHFGPRGPAPEPGGGLAISRRRVTLRVGALGLWVPQTYRRPKGNSRDRLMRRSVLLRSGRRCEGTDHPGANAAPRGHILRTRPHLEKGTHARHQDPDPCPFDSALTPLCHLRVSLGRGVPQTSRPRDGWRRGRCRAQEVVAGVQYSCIRKGNS